MESDRNLIQQSCIMIRCNLCNRMLCQNHASTCSKGHALCENCQKYKESLCIICNPLMCKLCFQHFAYEEYLNGKVIYHCYEYNHIRCIGSHLYYSYTC